MADYSGKVVGIKVYRNDVVVVREGYAPDVEGAIRGEITELSRKSRRRLAFVAANTAIQFRTMVTLTYPREFPSDGLDVKRHLRQFLDWWRKDAGGATYLWFLEFQGRGAPHIHILFARPWPSKRDDQKALRFRVATNWYRIVESGDCRHLAAGTSVERVRSQTASGRYAVKYAMKTRQKQVPPDYRNVGRFWGASRDVKPAEPPTIQANEDDVRAIIEGWEHAPAEDRTLYRVLYNQAMHFRDYISRGIDKGRRPCYHVPEGHSRPQRPQGP